MSISFGPKLGLLFNAFINDQYYDQFRPFLQALDQLINGSVINATTVVPPTGPSPGDAYLISSTGSGAWATFPVNSIAVWDTQVTNTGTNVTVPQWVNYVPKAGWILWNVALSGLYVYNGTTWTTVSSSAGANFPINTDITALTAITPTSGQAGIVVTATNGSYNAFTTTDGTHNSSWTAGGAISAGSLALSGNIISGQIQASAGVTTNALGNATPGTAISVSQAGGGANSLIITGTGTIYMSMLGFATYPTQTTVGAAGGASTLPATPTGYLPITIGGTTFVIPYYAHA